MKRALVMLLVAGAAWAADRECKYEPAITTIEGVVKNDRTFYGPPGFGSDPKVDAKEKPERLVLDAPISITPEKGDPTNEAVTDVSELQIVPNEVSNLSDYLDRRVRVTGKLFQAHTGHHHTKALIALETIAPVKAPSKSTR